MRVRVCLQEHVVNYLQVTAKELHGNNSGGGPSATPIDDDKDDESGRCQDMIETSIAYLESVIYFR